MATPPVTLDDNVSPPAKGSVNEKLIDLLKTDEVRTAIIFANRKTTVRDLAKSLSRERFAAGEIHGCLVEIGDLADRIRGVDRRRDRGQKILQALFACPDLCFRFFLLGDVAGDFRGADDAAFRVPYRGNGQRYVDEAAVLATPNGLEMIDRLSAPDAA